MPRIELHSALPWVPALVAFAGLLLLLVLYRLRMRSLPNAYRIGILTLRGVLLALTFLLLLDPQMVWTHYIQVPPRVGIFVDNSLSMAHHPSASASTVFSQVTSVVDWARGNNYEPVIMTFGERVSPRSDLRFTYAPDDRLTNFSPLAEIWQQDDLEAGFLFSDGVATAGRDPGALLRASRLPIYAVGVGDTSSGPDLSIVDLRYPLSLLDQEQGTVRLMVRATDAAQRRSRLLIFQADQLIHSQAFRITSRDFVQDFEAPVVGRMDAPQFRVELTVLSEEANINNNRREFLIDVLPGRRQVTLLTGSPSPNTALLSQVLGRTRHARVQRLFFLRGSWHGDEAGFWSTPQHLVVLENFPTTGLPEGHVDRLLAKLQRDRTPVLVVEGPDNVNREFVRLTRALGLRVELGSDSLGTPRSLRPVPSPALGSLRSGAMGRAGSSLPPAPLVHRLDPGVNPAMAPLLVDDDENLVISYGHVGMAKVSMTLLPGMAAADLKLNRVGSGHYFGEIINALVEWLLEPAGFSPYVIQPDRRQYHLGEKVMLRGIMRDRAGVKVLQPLLTLAVEAPGGTSPVTLNYDFEAGEYHGEFWPGEAGTYRLGDYDPEGSESRTFWGTFHVQAGRVELEQLRQNRYGLERLARATGGSYINLHEMEPFLAQLAYDAKTVERADHFSLWQFRYLWLVLVLLLAAEWTARRASGLI
ncbi:MAG: hypothetical protein V3U35_00105 [Candidatus Neomarinimicrobiota bacterium]